MPDGRKRTGEDASAAREQLQLRPKRQGKTVEERPFRASRERKRAEGAASACGDIGALAPVVVVHLENLRRHAQLSCLRKSGGSYYSPYGTQIFFTCVACSRSQRPSPCLASNQSMTPPSFVHTCFKFPVDIAFAAATVASSP